MTRKILIIGIGAGNPDFVTIQAVNALNQVDVFFIPDKGAEKQALRKLRTDVCDRFIKDRRYRTVDIAYPVRRETGSDYRGTVDEWHAAIGATYEAAIMEHLAEDECGAFLIWGDPTLYDSTLRIIETIASRGLAMDYEVIPGISSVQALAARHRVPLNRIGEPVLITTGRRLAEGFPTEADNVVVMLDGEQAFTHIPREDLDIFWGAYIGTADEVLVSGKLSEVAEKIVTIRARERADKGWIMDTYLLRRTESE